jgi:hypothetical protein
MTTVDKLSPLEDDQGPYLFTSPSFRYSRYGHRENDEWMGLVISGLMQPSFHKDSPKDLDCKFTSWSWDIKNDSGLKWKIKDEETLYKLKRLSVSKTFEAINQLKAFSENSIVHYWIESESAHGSKVKEFSEYLNLLKKSPDEYKYIIVNETLFDVTPKNLIFDLIEHAHPIPGSKSDGRRPDVINVFATKDVLISPKFGVGVKLPDLE